LTAERAHRHDARRVGQEAFDAVSSAPEKLAMFEHDIEKCAKVIAFANILLD